jgi:hypothetical protein
MIRAEAVRIETRASHWLKGTCVLLALCAAMSGASPCRATTDSHFPRRTLRLSSQEWIDTAPTPPAQAEAEPAAMLAETPDPAPADSPSLEENWRAQSVDAPGKLKLGQQLVVASTYLTLYGVATHVGSRRRVEDNFKVVRLEKAYVYDFVGHTYLVREVGGIAAAVQHFAGVEKGRARTQGVWWAEFGSEMYMEILNGWVRNVRFDPLDPVANFTGAMLATKGRDLAAQHEWIDRFSLQFGYKDWGRAFRPSRTDNATLASVWHDHTNGRFGLGYDIGPLKRPWVSVFLSYEITSLSIEDLKNRFGMGIELQPIYWLDPLIRKLPLGKEFLVAHDWLNRRVLLPGLYIQLFHVDAPAFSSQQPFQE